MQSKCVEQGCVNGKMTLFTSVVNCPTCHGKGYIEISDQSVEQQNQSNFVDYTSSVDLRSAWFTDYGIVQ